MGEMINRAREISQLCGIISEEELLSLSKSFYADFGFHWTEILDA